MILEHLAVSGLRNIERIELTANRDINWITGGNGAGKTSLLEAIFLLARGRSFRSRRHGPILRTGKDELQIAGAVSPEDDGEPSGSIKFLQHRKSARFFENGQPVDSIHELRNRLHVRMIGDNAQGLLEGQPRMRRLFLDWNLFHVEQGYGRVLADFRRIAMQRNAWLRAGARGPAVWDSPYCALATTITDGRHLLVEQLQEIARQISGGWTTLQSLELTLSRGWPHDRDLCEVLGEGRQQDRLRGFTLFGPSRADFSVRYDGRSALPSRGQTKLIVIALQLAAQHYWARKGGPIPIWLLDDLSAELDATGTRGAIDQIAATGAQLFISSVEEPHTLRHNQGHRVGGMFHVEHGALAP